MATKKEKTTEQPSDSLAHLNSERAMQQKADAFCFSLLIKGSFEAKLMEDFHAEFPNGDFIKAMQRANAAFELVALQPEEVITGKAIAQLDYQLAKANSAGDINGSINAIKARTEIFRKFKEKNEKTVSDNRPGWL